MVCVCVFFHIHFKTWPSVRAQWGPAAAARTLLWRISAWVETYAEPAVQPSALLCPFPHKCLLVCRAVKGNTTWKDALLIRLGQPAFQLQCSRGAAQFK